MEKTLCIARNTIREALRDKVMYSLVLFACLVVAFNRILTPLALGEGSRITRDVGLSAISLLGLFIIVLSGTALVHREIDRKTIAVILSKPVSRSEFIAGRFLGLWTTIALVSVGMAVLLQAVLLVLDGGVDLRVLAASLLTVFELMVITSLAVLFSASVSPLLGGMLTFAAYVAGSFSGDLLRLTELKDGESLNVAMHFLYYTLPNLEMFNMRAAAVHGLPMEPIRFGIAVLYAVAYSAAALLLAMAVFRRREFP
jgi:Cu-processing system permease protein